jgi:hypothetical protein
VGVTKKVTAVAQFQFRFRALRASGAVKPGDALAWTYLQQVKNKDFPPEAYLHLSQKQKFTPISFLDRTIATVQSALIVPDEVGGWRLALTDQSTVTFGGAFTNWAQFLTWTPAPALERLAHQTPGPLDLDTELQEEVVVREYEIGSPVDGDEPGLTVYPITSAHREFQALVGAGVEGKALRNGLDGLRKVGKKRPPLYGLMHYERCRLVLQVLSSFGPDGPEYLTISPEKVDKGALLRAMF